MKRIASRRRRVSFWCGPSLSESDLKGFLRPFLAERGHAPRIKEGLYVSILHFPAAFSPGAFDWWKTPFSRAKVCRLPGSFRKRRFVKRSLRRSGTGFASEARVLTFRAFVGRRGDGTLEGDAVSRETASPIEYQKRMSPHRSRHRSAGRASGTPAAGQCDAAGNMTSLQTGGDTGTTYTEKWDAWGRLVEVTHASGTPVESYSYDGTGRRIELTSYDANGDVTGVTHYYLSGQQVIQTSVTAGQTNPGPDDIQYQYVWSPRYIDAPILRDTYSGGRSGDVRPAAFYLDDAELQCHRGGAVQRRHVARCRALPVRSRRERHVLDHRLAPETTRATNNTILFAGCELDAVTGLYFDACPLLRPGPEPLHQPRPAGLRRQPDQPLRVLR